jgi:hypothetical protein
MPRTARRPAMTDPGELLLFVTEPQQLDAVFEFGTETLTVDSIAVPERVTFPERRRCCGGTSYDRCPERVRTGYGEAAFCEQHDDEGQAYATRDRRPVCYRCEQRFDGPNASICPPCEADRDARRQAYEAQQAPAAEPVEVVVVPCSGAKLDEPAPAGDLYLGSLHRLARQAASTVAGATGEIRILSALHGLVPLDRVIAPYDVTIGDAGAVDPAIVAEQLVEAGVTRVVALTPNRYTQLLVDAADLAGITVDAPLVGSRGIGEQRGRLARLRDGREV